MPALSQVLYRWLSVAAGQLATCQHPRVKNWLIQQFIDHYQVDLSQAIHTDPHAYTSFNDFFTRRLQADARPIDMTADSLVAPADGLLTTFGTIERGQLFALKGQAYQLSGLLANDEARYQQFLHGHYATIYLSPRDYHRVHLPTEATLEAMVHVPGNFWPVNRRSVKKHADCFAKNERVIAYFSTPYGPMAIVMVGAMIVASIATQWHGLIQRDGQRPRTWNYPADHWHQPQGAEVGQFQLGSTVVVLSANPSWQWASHLSPDTAVSMGQLLATQ